MLEIAANTSDKTTIHVYSLKGRIDSLTAADFEKFAEELLSAACLFILFNGENVESISSAGIAALLKFQRRLSRLGGAIAFVSLRPEVRMLFSFFSLDREMACFEGESEARQYLSEKSRSVSPVFEVEPGEPTKIEPAPPSPPTPLPEAQKRVVPRPVPIMPEDPDLALQPGPAFFKEPEPPRGPVVRVQPTPLTESPFVLPVKKEAEKTPEEESEEGIEISVFPALTTCRGCRTVLRIHAAGRHMCPSCQSIFIMNDEGFAEFVEIRERNKAAFREREEVPEPSAKEKSPVPVPTPARTQPPTPVASPVSAEREKALGELDFDVQFPEGRLVDCEQCGHTLRIHRSGLHFCPDCKIEFRVRHDGSASFHEKF